MQAQLPYWRLSGFYFFYFATLGAFLPYWSPYLKGLGFSAVEIGEISAIMVGTKIIAPNIWGWIADHTGKSLRIIRIASFFAPLFFIGFLYLNGYYWFAVITFVFSFFWNAALPQFEAATLFHLQEKSYLYSRIRLWGSIGFIVVDLCIGFILELHPLSILPLIVLPLLIAIWFMTMLTPPFADAQQQKTTGGLWRIIMRKEVIGFLLVYFLIQVSHGPYYVFYSIYLQENGYSSTNTGLLWALGVAAEVLLFVIMPYLLKKLGLRFILLMSLLLTSCRWLLIAWGIKNVPLMLAAQGLHAVSFGAAHVVAIHLVHRYFAAAHQGKGQALYSSVGFGLGAMIGSLVSGYYWEIMGGAILFTEAALISLLAFFVALLLVGKSPAQWSLR